MGVFRRQTAIPYGFAVVDLETTGLSPARDRVVELAIVQLDAEAHITGEFCTLIDPGRDVGPTRIHGIRAVDVSGAPTFAAAAATVWQLLSGRVLVAHNVSFDALFLGEEFSRCGVCLPPPPVMCTMQLASHYLHGLPARSLTACCQAAGVELSQHHSALHDARAAAQLLACYRAAHRQSPDSWNQDLITAAQTSWIPSPGEAEFQPVTRAQQTQRRAQQMAPLAALVDRLPRGFSGDLDAYLAVLDRVLEDRIVSEDEAASLPELATELGLTHETAHRAHREYLRQVCVAAWRDGLVTDAERADLLDVAQMLGVPAQEALTILDDTRHAPERPARHPAQPLLAGDRVVFTGDMDISRGEIEALATAAGLRVTAAVSAKTALIVAADPYSQSGKAKQARKLGVRMVTEQVFLDLLDHIQQSRDTTSPVR